MILVNPWSFVFRRSKCLCLSIYCNAAKGAGRRAKPSPMHSGPFGICGRHIRSVLYFGYILAQNIDKGKYVNSYVHNAAVWLCERVVEKQVYFYP